jgi:hypothetical protein
MRDLNVLRERIENAELQLKAAENARDSESEALMKMWRQIRHRFTTQEQEIAEFRGRVDQLTRRNDELVGLVEGLLATVESGLNRPRDETASKIAVLAEELLASEPELARGLAADIGDDDDVESGDVLELREAADDELVENSQETDRRAEEATDAGETLSPGIRSLVSRFESAMKKSIRRSDGNGHDAAPALANGDDGFARELREIEDLRHELGGLRRRMSDAVGAP